MKSMSIEVQIVILRDTRFPVVAGPGQLEKRFVGIASQISKFSPKDAQAYFE